ncbi:polysaccharide pyruvyl transferase family protein [Rossellomorea marisflavi]|uniref:polysaccharide pyruvyl transferase family protein n=1 Tax=Rossellomorea marisflavi TaxID=189381 RepID=UPI0034575851
MGKIGILTYHYSNNYGGVLQSIALYKVLKAKGFNVEIINYVPSYVNLISPVYESGLRKNIKKIDAKDLLPATLFTRINVKRKYNKSIISKFDSFRAKHSKLSKLTDETNITSILNDYSAIIVGSDQVWSPGERKKPTYFLDFKEFKGLRISYAADSTISTINEGDVAKITKALNNFDFVSVRNNHTQEFINNTIKQDVPIVLDPTLLWEFDISNEVKIRKEKYILVYVLGKELENDNKHVIKKIKEVHGDLKVIAINIPTRKFNMCEYADEVIHDLGPDEWLSMFKNAEFVFTDSFHGTLFSIKYKKSFLAYYTEELRATRFKDLSVRFGIDDFIVNNFNEIDRKRSLEKIPDFPTIYKKINVKKEYSENYLDTALNSNLK